MVYEMQRSAAGLLSDYEEVHVIQIADDGEGYGTKAPHSAGLHLNVLTPLDPQKMNYIQSTELLQVIETFSGCDIDQPEPLLQTMLDYLDGGWPTMDEHVIATGRDDLRDGAQRAAEKGYRGLNTEQYAIGFSQGIIGGYIEYINTAGAKLLMQGIDSTEFAKYLCVPTEVVEQIKRGEKYNPYPGIMRACDIEGY